MIPITICGANFSPVLRPTRLPVFSSHLLDLAVLTLPLTYEESLMLFTELKDLISGNTAPALEVHGVDPSIYLIFICKADARTPIKDSRGNNLTFRSRSKAFDALREIGVKRADFVHKSAFDEMVGVGDGTPTEHRETINLQGSEKCRG